jgi:hypothetical protein
MIHLPHGSSHVNHISRVSSHVIHISHGCRSRDLSACCSHVISRRRCPLKFAAYSIVSTKYVQLNTTNSRIRDIQIRTVRQTQLVPGPVVLLLFVVSASQ